MAYAELLDYARENRNAYLLQKFSNNLAVLYQNIRNPEEALVHLQTALEEARRLGSGSIDKGEVLRNTARAYGQLGNLARE